MDDQISQKSTHLQNIWHLAHKHQKASQVGYPSNTQVMHLCACCFQAIQKEPINLCQHTKQFQIFGFGYPLWYSFLKYCGILVLVLIISSTATSIYQATKQNYGFCYGNEEVSHSTTQHKLRHFQTKNHKYHLVQHFQQVGYDHYSQKTNKHPSTQKTSQKEEAHHVKCTSFMIFLSRFQKNIAEVDYFIRIIQFIAHLATLIYIRNAILKQEQYYDQRTCSMSDYSLILSDLPLQQNIQKNIRQLFDKQFKVKIEQIILFPKNKEIQELRQKLEKCQQKQQHFKKNHEISFYSQERESVRSQKSQTQQKLYNEVRKLRRQIDQDLMKVQMAIVVLSSEQDKADVLQKASSKNTYHKYFNLSCHISFKQAPQPKQIIWENIFVTNAERSIKVFFGTIFSIAFLALITIIFYFVMLAKTNFFLQALEQEHHDPQNAGDLKMFATIIVFLAIFGVVLFNKFIMGKILHIFVHFEKHVFVDKQNFSFALKYAIGMFFTTALMTLAVEAITFKNFYTHDYGVIQEETIMFMVTSFFVPIIWLINPFHLSVRIKRYFYHMTHMKQEHANQLMENFPYDLGKRYAQIIEIMWFTFLYSSLIPIGSLLTLIGIFLYYWVDKYNFLRRSTLKEGISGKMPIVSLKLLDITLLLVPCGQLLFDFILRNQFDTKTAIFAVIALIYVLLPTSNIILALNEQKFYLEQKKFKEVKDRFKHTYFNLHPIYSVTHETEVEQHRKDVLKYYKQKNKEQARMYSTGRGQFQTQKHQNKNQQQHYTQQNSII